MALKYFKRLEMETFGLIKSNGLRKKTSMLAADDIPDRCVVIVTFRLPTYNPTIFDQHFVAISQVSVRHPLQELEAAGLIG